MSRNKSKQTTEVPNKPKAVEGMPREEILELMKSHPEVKVDIRRRNHKMQWLSVAMGVPVTPTELLTFSEWLKDRAGGGDYRIDVSDPNTHRLVLPPWNEHVEGSEKIYDPRNGVTYEQGQPRATDPAVPGMRRHWTGRPDPREDPRSYSAFRSDELAVRQVTRLEQELRSERQGREADRRGFEGRLTALQEQIDKDRRDREERERDREREFFNERLRMMENRKPSIDWGVIAPALATVGASLITASRDRAAAQSEVQQSQHRQSTELLVAALSKKDDSLPQLITFIGTLAPLAKPVLDRMLNANSPRERADAINVMGEQMLQMAGMTAQFIQTMAESSGNDPAWLPFVRELTGGVERIAEAFVERSGDRQIVQAQGQPMQQAPGHGTQGPPPPQQRARGPRPAQAPHPEASPEQKTETIMAQLPEYLHTDRWRDIVYYMVLEQSDNVEPIAEEIVDYLTDLSKAEELPDPIIQILQDPRQLGPLFIGLVPVNEDYQKAVFGAVMSQLQAEARKHPGNGSEPAGTVATPDGPAIDVEAEIAESRRRAAS